MKQVIQNYKTGELKLVETPIPAVKSGGILVRNLNSLVSAGTEKLMINLAQKSLLGKAKARPDLVKQVINKIKSDGLMEAYRQAMGRLDTPVSLTMNIHKMKIDMPKESNDAPISNKVLFIFYLLIAGLLVSNFVLIENVPTQDEWEYVIDSKLIKSHLQPNVTVHPVLVKYIQAWWLSITESISYVVALRLLSWILFAGTYLIFTRLIFILNNGLSSIQKRLVWILFSTFYLTSPLVAGYSTIIEIDPFLALIFVLFAYFFIRFIQTDKDVWYLVVLCLIFFTAQISKITTSLALPLSVVSFFLIRKNYKDAAVAGFLAVGIIFGAYLFNNNILLDGTKEASVSHSRSLEWLLQSIKLFFLTQELHTKINQVIRVIFALNPLVILLFAIYNFRLFIEKKSFGAVLRAFGTEEGFLGLLVLSVLIPYIYLEPMCYYFPKHFQSIYIILFYLFASTTTRFLQLDFWLRLSNLKYLIFGVLVALGFLCFVKFDFLTFVYVALSRNNNIFSVLLDYLVIFTVLLLVAILCFVIIRNAKRHLKLWHQFALSLFFSTFIINIYIFSLQRIQNHDVIYSYGERNIEKTYNLVRTLAISGKKVAVVDSDFRRYIKGNAQVLLPTDDESLKNIVVFYYSPLTGATTFPHSILQQIDCIIFRRRTIHFGNNMYMKELYRLSQKQFPFKYDTSSFLIFSTTKLGGI
jgi:hypothetical protein